ncbi:tyrosine--tRNA ligase [Patescibacteria group bacterium]|nr:tyrosine--tRNA ligase [Patescibacteria group bacterium]MBU2472625.1 tyrosine--tRNA ligase [Patescibacteria group bacterium]
MTKQEQINQVLTRGVENIYPNKQALEKILKSNKKIRLYNGIDPTSPSLHLGHSVQMMKLKQFQDLGHEVIVLIGDFTAQIGDPTDKSAVRQQLTHKQVMKNCKGYKEQISKILDLDKVEFKYNSKWLGNLSFADTLELSSNFTAQQTLARDMFKKRMQTGKDLYLHEFLYPLMQAYDSVYMNVDLEVGGNDQMFNMLAGRTLMKKMKNKEKYVMTTKLLVDPFGKKMGKTEGNMVNLNEKPDQMFGQIMAWPDGLIVPGLELCTYIPMEEIKQIDKDIKENKRNPRDVKAKLAKEIISIYYSEKEAEKAEEEFNKIFKEKGKPTEIPICKLLNKEYDILDLLIETKLVLSKGEAKRLIEQDGVKIDNQKITDWQKEINIKDNMIIQVGKRKFIQIKV